MCELGTGQTIYLDNQGTQTIVTIASSSPGQQQQASNGFQSGVWTTPPELYRNPMGVVIRLQTAEGDRYIQIQGSSMSVMGQPPSLNSGQQMQMQQVAASPAVSMPPMQPMQSMPPMKMGDMEMSLNPMAMRMGNMAMSMASTTASSTPTRKFCSQCGSPIKPSDRFCASCGNRLE
jgi:hypothetical protein